MSDARKLYNSLIVLHLDALELPDYDEMSFQEIMVAIEHVLKEYKYIKKEEQNE